MGAENFLKLSDQAVAAIMVALQKALLTVATMKEEDNVDESDIDVSLMFKEYKFFVDDHGELRVENPVVLVEVKEDVRE